MQNNVYQKPYYNFQTPNILPPQQVTQVNGRASIDTIQMSPNSSVLLLDTTAPIVWLCVSDGVGRVSATPYDIQVHEEVEPKSDIERRLDDLEQLIKELKNDKQPNVTEHNTKQNSSKSQSGKNNVRQD